MEKIVPGVKRLGFVYDPGLDSSLSYLRTIKHEAQNRGWTVVEAAAPSANDVIGAMRNLVGKTDAVYIPNDTTVVAALEAIVKVGQQTHLPVFTGETRGVQRGAIASLSYNYTDVGLVAAGLVERVLKGEKPADIRAIRMADVAKHLQLVINKSSAEKMGVMIPADLLKQADTVY
jgi:putative ABC transport system substrate-binding protein